MQVAQAPQPIAADAVTHVTWRARLAAFLPPLSGHTLASVPPIILADKGCMAFAPE